MSKKIKVVTERWCCAFEDLVPIPKLSQPIGRGRGIYNLVRCKHCWTVHEYYQFTDAAGSTDWNYRVPQRPKVKVKLAEP
jgi:hypothetical protein